MGITVCGGAMLKCSFGLAPGSLTVLPVNRVKTAMPIANIMDNKPFVNIMPFAMCTSPANPTVAAATAAAMGVLTPMPCIPVTTAPWMPGSPNVLIASIPALNNSSKLMCTWGGLINVISPGQFTINVP
ncbi:MAG: DUF4280 domain-containing protein [Candidatus Methanoperedenaceae archaeon]|nr:MAG: DUF4280 domain-containing protein [Candidatus Methanoperedenaceae archaeon]